MLIGGQKSGAYSSSSLTVGMMVMLVGTVPAAIQATVSLLWPYGRIFGVSRTLHSASIIQQNGEQNVIAGRKGQESLEESFPLRFGGMGTVTAVLPSHIDGR